MKIGDLEGSSEEIHDFFQNNGLKVEDYFQRPQKPVGWFLVVVPAMIVLVGLVLLVLELTADMRLRMVVFIATCFFSVCWAVAIQVKFKNSWATTVVVVGCLLLALVAFGVFTPEQMFDAVQQLQSS